MVSGGQLLGAFENAAAEKMDGAATRDRPALRSRAAEKVLEPVVESWEAVNM